VSKAFTSDDASLAPLIVPPRRPLPAGAINYVTPRGLALLRDELQRLASERARLDASTSGDPDRPRALNVLAARIADLEDRLSSAALVETAAQPRDEVRFGARVTLRAESGAERSFQIVGVDEADASSERVAFVAPMARAILGKRVGDVAVVRTPRADEELVVVAIAYDPAAPTG
jgi:transcription elongation factor GreB